MTRGASLKTPARIILCCALAAATTSCVKLPRRTRASVAHPPGASIVASGAARISLNRASREELERLPGIGPVLAARVIEHRERHGPFRRAEHLMLVRGISERRFLALREHVTAE